MTIAMSIEALRRYIFDPVPHHRALGLSLEALDGNRVTMRLPYRADLVGDPTTGVLHGGAITTLLDSTAGCAVFAAMPSPRRVATLDLRIDYMRPATVGLDVIATGECFRTTKNVAFVRALAHHGDESRLIATATGTFAIFEPKPRPSGSAG